MKSVILAVVVLATTYSSGGCCCCRNLFGPKTEGASLCTGLPSARLPTVAVCHAVHGAAGHERIRADVLSVALVRVR